MGWVDPTRKGYYEVFDGDTLIDRHASLIECVKTITRYMSDKPHVGELRVKQPDYVWNSSRRVDLPEPPTDPTPDPEPTPEPEPVEPEPQDPETPDWSQTIIVEPIGEAHTADRTYLGSFRVEYDDDLAFGGAALSVSHDGEELIVSGHIERGKIGAVKIVEPGEVSHVTRPFIDMTNGKLAELKANIDAGKMQFGGTWSMPDGRILINAYEYYDVDYGQRKFFGWRNPDGTFDGWYDIPAGYGHQRARAGWMGVIPEPWATRLGYPMFNGLCGVAGQSNSSGGPSMHGFDPDDMTREQTAFIFYNNERWFGEQDLADTYHLADYCVGAYIHRDKIRCMGVHGYGLRYYGSPYNPELPNGGERVDGPPDPMKGNNRGYHAHPYHFRCWEYDLNDVLLWKQEGRDLHTLPVVTKRVFPEVSENGRSRLRGFAYDATRNREYVINYIGSSPTPTVHVYEVN